MAATASSRSCRRRARCRASWRCRTAAARRRLRRAVDHRRELRRAPVRGRAGARLLPVPRSRATATCSSTTKKSTTCGARSKANSRSAATARRCGSRPPPTARPTWSTSCCSSSRSTPLDCYLVPGPVNLNRFSAIYDLAQRSGPEVPAVHPRAAGAPGRRHRPVRGHPPARRAAASSLSQLRPGHGSAAPGRHRSAGAGDQADAVSHRR